MKTRSRLPVRKPLSPKKNGLRSKPTFTRTDVVRAFEAHTGTLSEDALRKILGDTSHRSSGPLKGILRSLLAQGMLKKVSGHTFQWVGPRSSSSSHSSSPHRASRSSNPRPALGRLPKNIVVKVGTRNEKLGIILLTPINAPPRLRQIKLFLSGEQDAAPGDQLFVRIRPQANTDGSYGVKIIQRLDAQGTYEMVGIVSKQERQWVVLPCGRQDQNIYTFDKKKTPQGDLVKEGDIVLARVFPGRLESSTATISQVVTRQDDPRSVSLITIHNHNLRQTFPESVLKESEEQASLGLEGRIDLSHFDLVTIDGADARDFDDAVWAEPWGVEGEEQLLGWHLLVAIADVAFYVSPGTLLDDEAYERSNSVYFPDRVLPMLPEVLSNGVCSLKPHEDRACLAVHLWIDQQGHLKEYRFVRGVMRSRARLTYEQVEESINNPDALPKELPCHVIPNLFKAFAVLKKARKKRGTLDFDVPEYQIQFDDAGHIQAFVPKARLQSHQLIEEFMILANVAAARALESRQAPCLYRVHEAPSAEKIDSLRDALKGLEIPLTKGQSITPKLLSHTLRFSEKTPYHLLVSQLVLRSQSQACYTPENLGHFGLSLPRYSHFTSPIRRYADLIVHRSLIKTLGLCGKKSPPRENLKKTGQHLSQMERISVAAERESFERYAALYHKRHSGKVFQGMITGVSRSGCFVRLDATGAEGLIPISDLGNDYYELNEATHSLVGRWSQKAYQLGQQICVRLVEVDPHTHTLTFSPTSQQ